MADFKKKIKIFKQAYKREISNLTKDVVVETMKTEIRKVTMYAIIPALIGTINAIIGIDTVLIMWIAVVLAAYAIHKKDMKNGQMINDGIVWVRLGTLVGLAFVSAFIQPSRTQYSFNYEVDLSQVSKWIFSLFLEYQLKACANIALYRLYLIIFGVIGVTVTGATARKNNHPNKVIKDHTKLEE